MRTVPAVLCLVAATGCGIFGEEDAKDSGSPTTESPTTETTTTTPPTGDTGAPACQGLLAVSVELEVDADCEEISCEGDLVVGVWEENPFTTPAAPLVRASLGDVDLSTGPELVRVANAPCGTWWLLAHVDTDGYGDVDSGDLVSQPVRVGVDEGPKAGVHPLTVGLYEEPT